MLARSLHLVLALALTALLAGLALSQGAPAGKKYALLVGVKEYESAKFDPLRFTENDVEGLAQALGGKGGFSVRLLTSTRGKAKAADAPTSANVKVALKAFLAGKKRNDLVLLAFAGHGMQQGRANYFCPSDAQINDTATLLDLEQVFRDLDGCGAGVRLLLVDACRNDPKAARSVDVNNLPRMPRGTAALFSCKSGERAFETDKLGKGHGVFFYYVLDGLKGAAPDAGGKVTWSSLSDYVSEKVSEEVPRVIGGGAQQTPHDVRDLTGRSPILLDATPRLVVGRGAAGEKDFQRGLAFLYGHGTTIDNRAAFRALERAAGQGHGQARGYLALCHHFERGTVFDRARAAELAREALPAVREAATASAPLAEYLLGLLHASGLGTEQDNAEAVRWYRKAADQALDLAQAELGRLYALGLGVVKDNDRAVEWLRKAADKGLAQGQNELGRMYASGWGVKKDHAEAAKWYRKAADQGHQIGQFNLGVMYANGRGVAKDETEAVRWYRLAADQGLAVAQSSLGLMYENGRGVKKDEASALEWYRKAADQGFAPAQRNLGLMYANGRGVKKDEASAVEWYRKAADKGSVAAQNNLGLMYASGRGVTKDEAEALAWYRKAADQGHAPAQVNLGLSYDNGRGVAKDPVEAVKWYRKAAETGSATAQNNLGAMFAAGRGVPQDLTLALGWYRKAADQGHPTAQSNLGTMYLNGRAGRVDYQEAHRWLLKSANQNYPSAQYQLGRLQEEGRLGPADRAEAIRWYRLASLGGHTQARDALRRLESGGPLRKPKN